MSLFARKTEESPEPRFVEPTRTIAPMPTFPAAVPPAEPTERPMQAVDEECDYLGRGSRIQGKLRFEGSVRIVGVVEGEIDATESVIVEQGAEVSARINAGVVLVHGTVTADVNARVRLEIGSTGSIRGKVVTAALVVHDGAVFEGACSMGGTKGKGAAKVPDLGPTLAAVPA